MMIIANILHNHKNTKLY